MTRVRDGILTSAQNVSRALAIGVWTMCALLLPPAVLLTPLLFYKWVPPYAVPSAEVATPIIAPGEPLLVSYHVIRRRVCRTELNWFVRDSRNIVVVRVSMQPGGAVPAGDYPALLNQVPLDQYPPLKPGKYVLTTTLLNECVEGMHATVTPSVEFEVR